MADVTDPSAAKFVREQVRPICEDIRAIAARITATQTTWYAGMNTLIGNSTTDHVIEGRTAEGVPDLTTAEVTNAVANFIAILTASNSQIISIPCVNALSAS